MRFFDLPLEFLLYRTASGCLRLTHGGRSRGRGGDGWCFRWNLVALFQGMFDAFLVGKDIGILWICLPRHLNKACCTLEVLALEEFIRHLQEITGPFPLFLASGVVYGHHVSNASFKKSILVSGRS
jgi:hypothetical protein